MTEPQPATLPEQLEKSCTVETMKVGQFGYAPHWAMWVDGDRHCWLDGRITLSDTPFERFLEQRLHLGIARRADGYHVWMQSDKKWSVSNNLKGHRIPVSQIHYWEQDDRPTSLPDTSWIEFDHGVDPLWPVIALCLGIPLIVIIVTLAIGALI